jgi:hypothetical protein
MGHRNFILTGAPRRKRQPLNFSNEITLSTSASLGSLSSGSPGFATGGLGLQCRALVGHRLACPADIALAALRDLTGKGESAHESLLWISQRIQSALCGAAENATLKKDLLARGLPIPGLPSSRSTPSATVLKL